MRCIAFGFFFVNFKSRETVESSGRETMPVLFAKDRGASRKAATTEIATHRNLFFMWLSPFVEKADYDVSRQDRKFPRFTLWWFSPRMSVFTRTQRRSFPRQIIVDASPGTIIPG